MANMKVEKLKKLKVATRVTVSSRKKAFIVLPCKHNVTILVHQFFAILLNYK